MYRKKQLLVDSIHYFLENNGITWAAGFNNLYFALAWKPNAAGWDAFIYLPKDILYFTNAGMKITDIIQVLVVQLLRYERYIHGNGHVGECGVDRGGFVNLQKINKFKIIE